MDSSGSDSSIDKCSCDRTQESDSSGSESPSAPKVKKSRISLPSLGFNLRRGRSLNFTGKKNKKSSASDETFSSSSGNSSSSGAMRKSPKWPLKFNYSKKDTKVVLPTQDEQNCCKCTCYKKKEENVNDEQNEAPLTEVATTPDTPVAEPIQEQHQEEEFAVQQVEIREYNVVGPNDGFDESIYGVAPIQPSVVVTAPFMECIRTIHEDCDEAARLARAREIEQGVEAPANFKPVRRVQLLCSDMETDNGQRPRRLQLVCPRDLSVDSLRALFHTNVTLKSCPIDAANGCHTQVDFIHCLVPDLLNITNCSFYWGGLTF